MWRKLLFFIGALALTAAGIAAVAFFLKAERTGSAAADPRTTPLLVRVANATNVTGVERAFTGTIAARVQSNLGFRVPGKIVERFVDVGQQVTAGQPLMRIDETDLRLALTAKRNAAIAARAVFVQARADEKRYATLVSGGLAASPQRYEQAKAALDTSSRVTSASTSRARGPINARTQKADVMSISVASGQSGGRFTSTSLVASVPPVDAPRKMIFSVDR